MGVERWGMIDAQDIVFPAVVEDESSALLELDVPAAEARALVSGDDFEVVERRSGRTRVSLVASEHRRGDWGSSEALAVVVEVRPRAMADAAPGFFMCPRFTNQRFERAAGFWALGWPTRFGDVDVRYQADEVTFTFGESGRTGFVLRLPCAPPCAPVGRVETVIYGYRGGEPVAVPYEFDLPPGVVDPDDVTIELGSGALARSLRRLGLPRVPRSCLWGDRLSSTIHLPRPLPPVPRRGPRRGPAW